MAIKVTISLGSARAPTQALIIDAMAAAMRQFDLLVADEARMLIRVRTGNTRQSIHAIPVVRTANGVIGGVAANDIGRYLERGTATFSTDPDVRHAKYPILPVRAKALAWPAAQGPSTMMGGSGRPLSYVESGSHGSQRPPITGSHVRLTGKVRTPIMRALQSGAIPYSSVFVVRRGVMHPGIRPRPFMEPAFDAKLPLAAGLVNAELQARMGR